MSDGDADHVPGNGGPAPGAGETGDGPNTPPQPDDLRSQRKDVSRYDVVILGLLVLFVAVGIGCFVAASQVEVLSYAGALFVSIAAAIALYHFLDTRALFRKSWVSLTGAGAIWACSMALFFYWQESRDAETIEKRDQTIAELQREASKLRDDIARLSTLTIRIPIHDMTGEIERGNERDFTFGILMDGELVTEDEETTVIVDGVPKSDRYRVIVYQLKNREERLGRFKKTTFPDDFAQESAFGQELELPKLNVE